jgi:hypothetical protein
MSPKDEAKLAALRAAAQVGFDAVEAGRYVEFRTRKGLREHLVELSRQVSAKSKKNRHGRA